MLCNRSTYEIMTPETVGTPESSLTLGKHSGRHMFRDKVEDMGYQLCDDDMERAYEAFKELSGKKNDISDGDIEALLLDKVLTFEPERRYTLKDFAAQVGTGAKPTASVTLTDGEKLYTKAAVGNGPVDAACKAMQAVLGFEPELKAYRSAATSERTDAQVDTRILIQYKGIQAQGRGASTDIVESSVRAYVDAVNRLYRAAAAREIKLSDE